jgi:Predicted integral membrane protein
MQIRYNTTMNKRKLLWLLPISITLFAFSNSALPGKESTKLSLAFLDFLQSLHISIPVNQLHLIIRKLAHFSEYTALGFTMFLADYYQSYQFYTTKKISVFLLFIPIIDEAIQLLSPGRSAQITDVLLDYSGIVFGVLLFYLLYRYLLAKRK